MSGIQLFSKMLTFFKPYQSLHLKNDLTSHSFYGSGRAILFTKADSSHPKIQLKSATEVVTSLNFYFQPKGQ